MIGIIICVLLMVLLIFIGMAVKDVTNPAFLLTVSWLFSYTVLVVGDYESAVQYLNAYSFLPVIGVVVFCFGAVFPNSGKVIASPKRIDETADKIQIKRSLKIFVAFESALIGLLMAFAIKYAISNYNYNIWYSINSGFFDSVSGLKSFCIYIAPVMIVLMNIFFVNYLSEKNNLNYLIIQTGLTFLMVSLTNGRAGLLRLLIPLVFIYMIMRKKSNMQIIKIGVKAFAVILALFFLYNSLKRVMVQENQLEYAINSFLGYAGGGITAFSQWCDSSHQLFYGAYTFRPIYSLLNALGYPVTVVSVFEPFLRGPGGTLGNVYTSLKWYANDFGLVYALLIQFVFGVIHFWLYFKMYQKRSTGYLIACATSMYPLLMQFFSDQYVTSTTLWIVYFLSGMVFLRTPLFLTRKNNR